MGPALAFNTSGNLMKQHQSYNKKGEYILIE